MKLNDMLNEQQLDELAPALGAVAKTPAAAVGQPAVPANSNSTAPGISNDPKMQTMMVAQQTKQKQEQRKIIQSEITTLTKQISDLRRQLSTIR